MATIILVLIDRPHSLKENVLDSRRIYTANPAVFDEESLSQIKKISSLCKDINKNYGNRGHNVVIQGQVFTNDVLNYEKTQELISILNKFN